MQLYTAFVPQANMFARQEALMHHVSSAQQQFPCHMLLQQLYIAIDPQAVCCEARGSHMKAGSYSGKCSVGHTFGLQYAGYLFISASFVVGTLMRGFA